MDSQHNQLANHFTIIFLHNKKMESYWEENKSLAIINFTFISNSLYNTLFLRS